MALGSLLRAADEYSLHLLALRFAIKDQVIAQSKQTAYQEGMFVVEHRGNFKVLCSAFDVADNTELHKVSELVVQSVSVWEQQVKRARPIALILSDYFGYGSSA